MLNEDFLREYGLRLKILRIKKKITQAQLGEMVNISEHRISQIENGKCNLTLVTVNKIASALEIDSYKLFLFD